MTLVHNFADKNKRVCLYSEQARSVIGEEALMLHHLLAQAGRAYDEQFRVMQELIECFPEVNVHDQRVLGDFLEMKEGYARAFNDLLSVHPDRAVIQEYVRTSVAVAFSWWTNSQNPSVWNAWLPPYSPETRQLVDAWRTSEESYADLGYRTVSITDWRNSVGYDDLRKHLPRTVHHLLLVLRGQSEKPRLYAAQWIQNNPWLIFS